MKNMKISQKFIVTFGVILVCFIAASAFAIFSLTNVLENFTNFYERPHENILKVDDMRSAIQSVAKNVGYSTMSEDKAEVTKHINSAQADLDKLSEGVEFLTTNFTGDKKLVTDFTQILTDAIEVKEQVFAYSLANKNQEAIELFFNEYQGMLLNANSKLLEISEFSTNNAASMYNTAASNSGTALIIVIALIAIAFAITIILAIYITKSLTTPIKELELAAKKLAAGDLEADITYTSKDELGSLAEGNRELIRTLKSIILDMRRGLGEVAKGNFNITPQAEFRGDFIPLKESIGQITVSLSDTMRQINEASDQVSSGGEQVSSGAQALSQGATEQASSIEELSATISEISGQINRTAENAAEASTRVNSVGIEISESNSRMQNMLTAMGDISASSSEIGKIINTIENIAFQTNILALNAAVEAARAGVAGKGFAVVADEVRNLASKSAEASKNTSALIESSLKAVENGTKIADDTAHSLNQVVAGVHEVTETVNKISLAASEQAQAIAQVNMGVDQISSVVQTNSATAQQSAAASEELSGQAVTLRDLVGKFKLTEVDGDTYNSTPYRGAM